ncbi:hypothetical protein PanWU01x14_064490 [Parasponia andersonii]|uniref:Uncharacterized protein n=1 Tax=Parasponia andersonii TaxID=3476 RepID=A0A2P5DHE2_PARAD|nr:hypothetical protein PanWU01x14_064490 [Parasponia andersonii]
MDNHQYHYLNHHHKLQRLHSLKFPRSASSTTQNSDTSAAVDDVNIHRYTSLRDLDVAAEGNDFNCINIAIKNRLVKRAASAYLQSAAILVTRNENCCFSSFWEKLRNKAALRSCWRIYVQDPIRACFRPLLRFFPCMAWSP